jgi:hypothetical protein
MSAELNKGLARCYPARHTVRLQSWYLRPRFASQTALVEIGGFIGVAVLLEEA